MAKGHGRTTTITNTNSHITVAGTTYQNVGGDYILDGAIEKGKHMTGHISGGIHATSRQDTKTYEGRQSSAGFNVDIDLAKQGAGSSIAVNGGRTKANADYKAVTEQTGFAYQKSDVIVHGKSTFKGAYFTTATQKDNQTQFNGGLQVSDIQNHSNYKADDINVGISTKAGQKPKISGIGYGKDGDNQTSTTYGAVTGMAGKFEITTNNVSTLNETLVNNFDKDRVNQEIDAQIAITQEYGKEMPKAIGDYASNK
ncbi:hemagglutinin repeat-containing protein [Moraxella nasovis]|uniref:hemagglutinin repeat-containing protein n=1 Tax=Moraxella nasovis TaxID=2904121 RepID=UPI001F6205DA|nr:hemagglutinin repeat-containing protein [Moraxella nasovis]UNU73957.1 hemagglutinin repeat-containing protein [Moraxella nasovis]